MRPRGDIAGPAMLPRWQFPALDPEAEASPLPAAFTSTASESLPATAADDSGERRCQVEEQRRSLEEAAAQAVAAGRAEGLAKGHAEGAQKGYDEGFAAGSQAAQATQAELLRRFATLVERLASPIPALERAVEEAVVALALEVARCVIGSEISGSPEHLVRLIREALTQAPLAMIGVQVALNPDDLDAVRAAAPEIERGGAVLVADPAVEAGGALIAVGGEQPTKDRRWHPRGAAGESQIDLSLAGRWRNAMLALFDGEGR